MYFILCDTVHHISYNIFQYNLLSVPSVHLVLRQLDVLRRRGVDCGHPAVAEDHKLDPGIRGGGLQVAGELQHGTEEELTLEENEKVFIYGFLHVSSVCFGLLVLEVFLKAVLFLASGD